MYNLIQHITKHPNENNMTYKQHFIHASKISFWLGYASICLFIHAIYPPLNETVASDIIKSLYNTFISPDKVLKKKV